MKEFEHVRLADKKVLDGWFNFDRVRFEIVPSQDEADQEATAERVERLVNSFRATDEQGDPTPILKQLLELHGAGKILWPISLAYGGSCIGEIDKVAYREVLTDALLYMKEIDELFLTSKDTRYADYKKQDVRSLARSTWLSAASIIMASRTVIDDLAKFQSDHIKAYIEVARIDGAWAGWTNLNNRRGIAFLSNYFAKTRSDPNFGYGRTNYGVSGRSFRRNTDVFAICEHLEWLKLLYGEFLDEKRVMGKYWQTSGLRLMGDFYSTLPADKCSGVRVAFCDQNLRNMIKFAATWNTAGPRRSAVVNIIEFLTWAGENVRSESGDVIDINMSSAGFSKFLKEISSDKTSALGSDVAARPMPTRYHALLKQIISENDFAWPKSLVAKNGHPLHHCFVKDTATGREELVFCPVLPRMLLLLLDIPLRAIQARRLDSGEGDTRRWDPKAGLWQLSTSPHAGYWAKRHRGDAARRGVIRELPTSNGSIVTGFWINSNKTQDRKNLFDETSGYEIPWENREVLENLAAMREWQELYNPVKGPLPYSAISKKIFAEDPSEGIRRKIPDRFYLFRYPLNGEGRKSEAPPSHRHLTVFFHEALSELERRLNEEDPGAPVRFITNRDRAGRPMSAVFTIHGMRSSTLTGLHLAGVPIEVLSKVVAGHASILMTLKYLKFDPLHISQVLTEARVKSIANARDEFPNYLRKASFENAVRMTARLTDDGLAQVSGAYSEASGWAKLDIGLCPNGCTQCHIGGPVLVSGSKRGQHQSTHAPVPGGRNCVRCRFFITGLPFLIPLWTHGMAILAKAEGYAQRMSTRDEEVRALKAERMALSMAGQPIPPDLRDRIDIRVSEADAARDKRDEAFAHFHATLALIEKVRAISPEGDGGALPMLLPIDELPTVQGRESSRFEVSDAIVQASRCFPSIETPELERERDAFLDQILYRNGFVPITMAPLTQSEKRRAADAMSAMLLVQIGAIETEKLIDGRKTLADFDLAERLEDTCRHAVGAPIGKLALVGPRAVPRTIEIIAAE